MGLGVGEVLPATALPRDGPKHGVRESRNTPPALRLREVDRLRDRRVLGNAAHI